MAYKLAEGRSTAQKKTRRGAAARGRKKGKARRPLGRNHSELELKGGRRRGGKNEFELRKKKDGRPKYQARDEGDAEIEEKKGGPIVVVSSQEVPHLVREGTGS